MSLRTRLILSFSLIAVVSLGIATITTAVLLQKYRNQAMVTKLEDTARPISIQLRSLLRGQTAINDVWNNMLEQAQKNNVYIFIADDRGTILRHLSPDTNAKANLNIIGELPHSLTESASGTFRTATRQTFVYVAYPIGLTARAASNVTAAAAAPVKFDTLFLATPQTGTTLIWASLLRPFVFAIIIALFISIITAVLLARSLYKPVLQLEKAAANISRGQYDQKIDVSGPKEIQGLAASFNEMSQNVKESHLQLRHFVADVSHQLKSPLTSIQGFAQAMLDGTAADDATRQKASQIIVDESKRMIRQVNELLELSRMQAGQIKMAQELVDIKELVMHCQEIFAVHASDKSVHLKTDIEPLSPVIGDTDRLEDVFSNIIDNAIKNTPAGGTVDIIGRNNGTGNVIITVADSGPGIPPEQLPFLFKRFYQASGLRSGFGLGLAIARETVLAHKGKIEVFSSPGEGARFVITLNAGIIKGSSPSIP